MILMYKVPVFTAVAIILLLFTALSATVCASVSVGVKQGDWIEYTVDFQLSGHAGTDVSLTPDHNITWAKMEITHVQGTQISLNIQTLYSNGTIETETVILDLEEGKLGDDFIIPANLNVGDYFFDKNQGNITITGVTQKDVAGVQRPVISAATAATSYTWDQATGILLTAQTTLPEYTMTTTVSRVSFSQHQSPTVTVSPDGTPHSAPQTPASEPTPIYAIAATVAVVLAIAGLIIMRARRPAKLGKP